MRRTIILVVSVVLVGGALLLSRLVWSLPSPTSTEYDAVEQEFRAEVLAALRDLHAARQQTTPEESPEVFEPIYQRLGAANRAWREYLRNK
jgi:hypothetical protein